jgi:RNA polymerase sigma factor (sigma-70 family)
MMTPKNMSATGSNDAELVSACLDGNRDAFGRIVTRYQSLVCSLAYSATGSLGTSEDLAQETFITAWKCLRDLREPGKLRAWLCGIARNRISNALRREGRQPLRVAEPLDAADEQPATEPLPPDQVISTEEEAILWRSLERIPETYREPLVLFYREHQSVQNVAAALELSEDAVKQRLARGRKLLHEQVLAFVEGALERTAPGKAFTVGVLAALPVFATSASAATVGATAAKGSTLAKAAASAGLAGAILGPLIGILGGILGTKASIENTESPRERQFMVRVAKWTWALAISFGLAIWAFIAIANAWWQTRPVLVTATFIGASLGYVAILIALILWTNRTQRRIRQEEASKEPQAQPAKSRNAAQPVGYRSRWTLLGLPLVHVQMERRQDGRTPPAKGWIAIGSVAYGALFAAGGVAIAPISMGGFAVGLVALGGATLGVLSFAGLALGVWAVGGAAVGYEAFAGGAMGWRAAMGGMAVAHDFALGGAAFAQHANDAAAQMFMQNSTFFRCAAWTMRHAMLLIWLPMLLVIWQVMQTRKRNKQRRRAGQDYGRASFLFALLLSALAGGGCGGFSAEKNAVTSTTLTNGINIVSVHFPHSTNVSVFSFLPMGLTSDEPNQAQWSHLVEHLVIRSTMPADSTQANAETLPDHMRLDFYGNSANWKEGLLHHRRWLEGVPFTGGNLAAEKPKVIAECDFTARNFATHKFAVAAWVQGFRHGSRHVALKGDVTKAALADVQRFRDERLAVSNQVTVCIVGGVEAKTAFAEAQTQFGGLRLRGGLPPGSEAASTNLDLTWDLDARHILVTWPIPDFRQEEHAALMVAAQAVNMRVAPAVELKRQTGMIFAGADLVTPEGGFFFISASLRPGAEVEVVRKAILNQVEQLATDDVGGAPASMIGRQLAANLNEVPSPQSLKSQIPPGMSPAMLEGNVGLQMGMHAHRYGHHRTQLAQQLAEVSVRKVQDTARAHLTAAKAAVCTLRPSAP